MNVTIDDITSALRYLGRTLDCDTNVYTVQASIEIKANENTA